MNERTPFWSREGVISTFNIHNSKIGQLALSGDNHADPPPGGSMKQIVLVDGPDYQGLYVDGKLEYCESVIEIRDLLRHAGSLLPNLSMVDVDGEWFDEVVRGEYPDSLSDVKLSD